MKVLKGSVTSPKGFLAGGVCAKIKNDKKKDLGIIYSTVPALAAGVFTQNTVRAACVSLCGEYLQNGKAQAIVVNSGNANACTGAQGYEDAKSMAFWTAQSLNIKAEDVLVASTGVIGVFMPMDKLNAGIKAAAVNLSPDGSADFAQAIMTTDLAPKEIAVEIEIAGFPVKIGAAAKGSGMIHPDMATLLGFVTTDANISLECLQLALKQTVAVSFNMISIDRDTSTNDAVMIIANAQAGNQLIDDPDSKEMLTFIKALEYVNVTLAKMIARDGEGASHLLEVRVENAARRQDACILARAVTASNLVKAAVFGKDANWGRILCAAGYSGAVFDPDHIDVFIGDIQVAKNGCAHIYAEEDIMPFLEAEKVMVRLDLKSGDESAVAWGCDLTYDYVRINADYRS